MLRADLDKSFEGGREAWSVALMPLAFPAGASSVGKSSLFAGGAIIMSKTLVRALLAILVGSVLLLRDSSSPTTPLGQRGGATGEVAAGVMPAGARPPAGAQEVELGGEGPAPSARVAIDEEGDGAEGALAVLGGGSEEAVLVVYARDQDTGSPIPNVRVYLWPPDDEDTWGNSDVEGSVGAIGRAPLTDGSGRAEFQLPPGVEFDLSASGEEDQVSRVDHVSIAALGVGERRDLVIQLQVGYDLRFVGRVVDAEDGAPISLAQVRIQERADFTVTSTQWRATFETHTETSTDLHGFFEVLIPSWEALDSRIDAPGYGPVRFAAVAGHEQPSIALEIEVRKSARLLGTLSVSNKTSAEGFHVYASESDWNPPFLSWTADVLADGYWEIGDLPAGVPLEIEVRGPGRELRMHQTDIVLVPGEERVLDWGLDSGATLRGRAVAAGSGIPCGDMAIWLLPADWYTNTPLLELYTTPTADTRTDQNGQFVFTDVEAGRWLVAPAPEMEPGVLSAAPVPKIVEISTNEEDVDVLIEVWRGLYIRGTVEDPEGGAARGSLVHGALIDSLADVECEAQCNYEGSFSLGPLPPGDYLLRATKTGHLRSDPVIANAGSEGVVVSLNPGSSLRGKVVNAESGARMEAEVGISWGEDPEDRAWSDSDSEGRFKFDGLVPGTYSIKATSIQTNGGYLCGVITNVHLPAESLVDDLVVSLEIGAELHVAYDGQSEWMQYQILMGGALIGAEVISPGEFHFETLPPGEVTVRFIDMPDETPVPLGERTVTLVAGEKAKIVWPHPGDDN